MNKVKNIFFFLIGVMLGWFCSDIYHGRWANQPIMQSDTVIVTDTIVKPICKDSMILSTKIVRVPFADIRWKTDTCYKDSIIRDSIEIALPIERKVYEDSLYKAVISGYDVSLDSIMVKNRVITNTRTQFIKENSHFGISFQGGYGLSKNGWAPYIGIGVSYNIISW